MGADVLEVEDQEGLFRLTKVIIDCMPEPPTALHHSATQTVKRATKVTYVIGSDAACASLDPFQPPLLTLRFRVLSSLFLHDEMRVYGNAACKRMMHTCVHPIVLGVIIIK